MILKRHKQFLKDFQKTRLTDGQFEKLVAYLNALRTDTLLPPESKDHSLEGNYNDCRGTDVNHIDSLYLYADHE